MYRCKKKEILDERQKKYPEEDISCDSYPNLNEGERAFCHAVLCKYCPVYLGPDQGKIPTDKSILFE